MEKKNCFLIGTIFKLHGYKGNVVIYNENATPLKLNDIDFLLIEKDNTLIPFFIDKIRSIKPHNLLVKFQDINFIYYYFSFKLSSLFIVSDYLPMILVNLLRNIFDNIQQ